MLELPCALRRNRLGCRPRDGTRRSGVQIRVALENGVHRARFLDLEVTALSNVPPGREGDLRYCGQSCVAGPDGSDLARAGRGEELILADLDLKRLSASRRDNTYLADRRPELYGALVAGPTQVDGDAA